MSPEEPAPLEPDLAVWAETILVFAGGQLTIDLREPVSPAVGRELAALGLDQPFAVVTPCNPRGTVHSASANAGRLAARAQEMAGRTPPAVVAEGRSPDGRHREPGWAVIASPEEAIALAREWDQLGFYWWDGHRFSVVRTGLDQPTESESNA